MNKSERLNQELIFLNLRNTFNIKDLMKEFGISRRTAFRDVQELEALGIPLYVESGRNGKYHVLDHTSFVPLYFTENEIASALFAIRSLENMIQTPFDESYSYIYQKLLAIMSPERKKAVVEALSYIEYKSTSAVAHPAHLSKLLSAAHEQKVQEIEYDINGIEKISVYVYDLFFRDGYWFINGYDGKSKEWRVYRCDRILSCRNLPGVSYFPNKEAAEKSLMDYKASRQMLSFKCLLTPIGRDLYIRYNYTDMEISEAGPDEYLLVGEIEIDNIDNLVNYFISFGPNIQRIEPEEVARAYTKKLEKMLDRSRTWARK